MMARSSTSRNTRGLGLPGCGCGVTEPISTKPKPAPLSPVTASACLSKPAAIPTGLDSVRLNNFTFCNIKQKIHDKIINNKFRCKRKMKSHQRRRVLTGLCRNETVFEGNDRRTMTQFWWTLTHHWHQYIVIELVIVFVDANCDECAHRTCRHQRGRFDFLL